MPVVTRSRAVVAKNNKTKKNVKDLTSAQKSFAGKRNLSKWLAHVNNVKASNPGLKLKKVLSLASKSYTSVGEPRHVSQRHNSSRQVRRVSESRGKKIMTECYLSRKGLSLSALKNMDKESLQDTKSSTNSDLKKLARSMRSNMSRSRKNSVAPNTHESMRFRCNNAKDLVVDMKGVSSDAHCSNFYVKPFGNFTPRNISRTAKRNCRQH